MKKEGKGKKPIVKAAAKGKAVQNIGEVSDAERKYKFLVDHSEEIILLLEKSGKIDFANKKALSVCGYPEKEFVGKNISSFLTKKSLKIAMNALLKEFLGFPQPVIDVEVVTKSGQIKIINVGEGSSFVKEPGKKDTILVCAWDVTEKKKIEDELEKERLRFSSIVEQSPFSTWISDSKGTNIMQNESCRKLFGMNNNSDTVGKYNLFKDNLLKKQGHLDGIKEVFTKAKTYNFVTDYNISDVKHLSLKSGVQRILDVTIFPIKDESGRVINAVVQHRDITEQKSIGEAIKESERKLRCFIDSTEDMMFMKDDQFRYVLVNKANAEFFGKKQEDVIGKTDFDLMSRAAAEGCRKSDIAAIKGKKAVKSEEKVGDRYYESSKASLVFNGKKHIIGTIHDVTEKKKAETLILQENSYVQQRENLLSATLESTKDGILVVNNEGMVTHYNTRFMEMWKMPKKLMKEKKDEKLLGHALLQLKNPDAFLKKVKELYKSRKISEDFIELKDGRIFERHSSPLFYSGKVYGRVWNFRDITERAETEKTIKESKDFLDNIIDSIPSPVFVKDSKHVWVVLNDAMCKFMGGKREDLIGKSDYDFFPKEEADIFWKKDEEVFKSGKQNINEEKFTDANGFTHTVVTTKSVYSGLDNKKILVGVINDITDIRKAEEALKESESKYSSLVENAKDGVVIVQDGAFKFSNHAFSEMAGYARESLADMELYKIDPEGKKGLLVSRYEKRMKGEEVLSFYEHRILSSDGKTRDVSISASMINYLGKPADMLIIRDITEQKRAEKRFLERNEQLEKFHSVAVDRELKMIELKRRIKELEGKK